MIAILVGIQVDDPSGYTTYREQMTPLLIEHGGAFGVDVRVAEVLKPGDSGGFNRLFTICFPSAARRDAFFADPRYVAVRAKWFEPSTSNTALLGAYSVLA